MHIVAVHQRCDLAFLSSAAEYKSLFRWQVLTIAPRRYVKRDEGKSLSEIRGNEGIKWLKTRFG